MSDGWCTIESDPAVFSEMIEKFGVSGVVVEEVISLDDDSLAQFDEIYGLVLLFKWKRSTHERTGLRHDSGLYFAKQIVQNACATQAVLNILLNNAGKISLGPALTNFLEFTAAMDPQTRGEMVGQSDVLRVEHNSFARSTVFSFEDKLAKEDDDVYHFSAFIFKDGAVWELDGLQEAPIFIAEAAESNWRGVAALALQTRMAELASADQSGAGQGISFSLLAVVSDRLDKIMLQISEKIGSGEDSDALQQEARDLIAMREAGRAENNRRRHNYIPMLVELLRALAEKGKLEGVLEAAKRRALRRKGGRQVAKTEAS